MSPFSLRLNPDSLESPAKPHVLWPLLTVPLSSYTPFFLSPLPCAEAPQSHGYSKSHSVLFLGLCTSDLNA